MSAKSKSPVGMKAEAAAPETDTARATMTAAALEGVYGPRAEPPALRYPLPLGTLSAGAAAQVAELLPRVGLPQRMALVCELSLPAHPGGLPELVVAVPHAMLDPFRRLSEMAGETMGTAQRGPEAGVAMALGACGRARLATLQTKPPAELAAAAADGGKSRPPALEDVISETLGLLRMAEKCGSDPAWIFGDDSPVWMLFLTVGNRLEEAYKAHMEINRRERAALREGLTVQVVQTGKVVSPEWEGGDA